MLLAIEEARENRGGGVVGAGGGGRRALSCMHPAGPPPVEQFDKLDMTTASTVRWLLNTAPQQSPEN